MLDSYESQVGEEQEENLGEYDFEEVVEEEPVLEEAAGEDAADAKYESLITGAFGRTYVSAEAKYEDLKSSAQALLFTGFTLTILMILQTQEIIRLPFSDLVLIVIGIMGVAALIGSIMTFKSANIAKAGIQVEQKKRQDIINWFMTNYSAQTIDKRVMAAETESSLEEEIMDLKRMNMIQSFLQREFQIEEEGFLEVLAEEIYEKLYDSRN